MDYDTAIRLKSDYVEAYCERAVASEMCGQYESAISDWDVILQRYSESPLFYSRRARARKALNQREAAVQDCHIGLKFAAKKGDVKMKKRIQRQLRQLTDINKQK